MKRVTFAIPAVLFSSSLMLLTGCEAKSTDTTASVKPASVAADTAKQADASKAAATTDNKEATERSLSAAERTARGTKSPDGVQRVKPSDVRIEERFTANPDGTITKAGAADRLADRTNSKGDVLRKPAADDVNQFVNPDAPIVVRPEPAELYLGEISTGDAGHGVIKLVNSGGTPMKLIECKSSCGCTTTNCPKNTIIPPGGSVELEVRMNAGAMPAEIAKSLTYVVENHPMITVPVSASVISFISLDPAMLDTDVSLDNKLTLKAMDNQPFVITSMIPPIITEFSTEPATEHTVEIDWDAYVESAFRGRLTFYTNHPKCRAVYATVRGVKQREAVAKLAEKRQQSGVPGLNPVQQTQADRAASQFSAQQVTMTALDVNLHVATKSGNIEDMTIALDAGAKFDARDTNGKSAIHLAANSGHIEAIDLLVERGADLEARDRAGRTPLMWAVESRNPQAIEHLVHLGADLTARDGTGATALMWAAGFGTPETLKAVIDSGAELADTDDHGMTPLMWAASFGDGKRVKMLIDAGLKVDIVDGTRGCTAIMYAARSSGSVETLQALIDAGADLSLVDVTGRTALSWAALLGSPEKVQALLAAGSDVLKEDFRGWTPLQYAENRRDRNGSLIVSMLKDAVARANGETDKSASDNKEPVDPQARR